MTTALFVLSIVFLALFAILVLALFLDDALPNTDFDNIGLGAVVCCLLVACALSILAIIHST